MKHPIWQAYRNLIQVDESVPLDAKKDIDEYRLLLSDMWLEKVANKLIKLSKMDMEKIKLIYSKLRAKKRFDLADKFREILAEVGFKIGVNKLNQTTIYFEFDHINALLAGKRLVESL